MVRVERTFVPAGRPCGDYAVHSIAFGKNNDQNSTSVRFSKMESARFPVAEECACIQRVVLNYLFRFFRCDAVEGDMVDVAAIP